MQHLSQSSRRYPSISRKFSEYQSECQEQVRFFTLHQIKLHASALVKDFCQFIWVFTLQPYSPGGRFNGLTTVATLQGRNLQIDIIYGVDYQGSLILFSHQTFAPKHQSFSRELSSPLVFLQISMYSTIINRILTFFTRLQPTTLKRRFYIERRDCISNLTNRLRALYAQ